MKRRRAECPRHDGGFYSPSAHRITSASKSVESVVGYGFDYQGKYRNLPYVGVLKTSAAV